MRIWVDADGCPVPVKELLCKTADRRKQRTTFVANRSPNLPRSAWLDSVVVPNGMNLADRRIVELLEPGDLVVTADVPLAADVIAKGGLALNPRGELYTETNIGERLALRNLLDELRGGNLLNGGGPSDYGPRDRQAFANTLDRILAQAK